MRRASILPIAVMAFAIVAFLFIITWAVTPGLKWPWSVNKTATNVTVSTNTAVTTNTVVANTNSAPNPTADWKTFQIKERNITFKYPSEFMPWTADYGSTDQSFTLFLKAPDNETILAITTPHSTNSAVKQYVPRNNLTDTINQLRSFDSGLDAATTYTIPGGQAFYDPGINEAACGQVPNGGNVAGANYLISVYIQACAGRGYSLSAQQNIIKSVLSSFVFTSPTADWKTYTNSTIGFGAKYPATWTVSTCEDNYVAFDVTTHHCATSYSSGFNLKLVAADSSDALISNMSASLVNPTQTTINVAGVTAQRVSGISKSGTASAGAYNDMVYLPVGTKILRIHYIDSQGSNPQYQIWFNSFLANLTLTTSTAGWKTYTDTAHHFSLKYPTNIQQTAITTSDSGFCSDCFHPNVGVWFHSNQQNNTGPTMRLYVLDRKLDANNIEGMSQEKISSPATLVVGGQSAYKFDEPGDSGCGGTAIQTAVYNNNILQICFPHPQAADSPNIWYSDPVAQQLLLSTFTFTK